MSIYRQGSNILRLPGGGGIMQIPSGGGFDPYPLYPSFNRNLAPWHSAPGIWGPQYILDAPTPANTNRNVTVNSVSEFDTEAAVSGTQITVGTSFAGFSRVTIRGDDIRVIIPPGIRVGGIQVGDTSAFPVQINPHRVEIIGALDGSRGGLVGQIRGQCIEPSVCTDLIVDGLDLNADGDFGTNGEQWQGFRGNFTRAFIHNVRGIAPAYMSQTGWQNVLFANCNFYAGAVERADVGYPEGWAFRDPSGPIYFVDCPRIQTTRYHVIRPYTNDLPGEYFFMKNCNLVNVNEGQIGWLWNRLSEPAWGYGLAAIIEDCGIYQAQSSTCDFGPFGQIFDQITCTYSRVRRNTIYSGGTGNNVTSSQSWLDDTRTLAIAAQNADSLLIAAGRAPLASDAHVVNDGNIFATLTTLPPWSGPGDPTTITLPNGWTLDTGSALCPAVFS